MKCAFCACDVEGRIANWGMGEGRELNDGAILLYTKDYCKFDIKQGSNEHILLFTITLYH